MNKRKAIFLSASIPYRKPFAQDVQSYEIREAVVALVGVCHEFNVDLVFGGHPAITPLVHHAARSLGFDSQSESNDDENWNIAIYQSMYFADDFPTEVKAFQEQNNRLFHSISRVDYEGPNQELNEFDKQQLRQINIRKMREAMITNYSVPYIAAVFLGGMEGIIDEFQRFRRSWQNAVCFPVPWTGGATRIGWPESTQPVETEHYPSDHPRPGQLPLINQLSRKELSIFAEASGADPEHPNSSEKKYTYRTMFRRLLLHLQH